MTTKEMLKKFRDIFEGEISKKDKWQKCMVIAVFMESMALAILESYEDK